LICYTAGTQNDPTRKTSTLALPTQVAIGCRQSETPQARRRRGKGEWKKTTNLLLGESRDESGLDDEGEVRESTLTEDLAVTEGKGVDDGDELAGGLGEVLLLLSGDERPNCVSDETEHGNNATMEGRKVKRRQRGKLREVKRGKKKERRGRGKTYACRC
jgi:hypothetical protein